MAPTEFVTEVFVRCRESGAIYDAMMFSKDSKDRVYRWLQASPKWSLTATGTPDEPGLSLTLPDGDMWTVKCGWWIVKVNNSDGVTVLTDERFRKAFEVVGGMLDDKPESCDPQSCDQAPPGWTCSRRKGHRGPCAAHRNREVRHRPAIRLALLTLTLQTMFAQSGEQSVLAEFADDDGNSFTAEVFGVSESGSAVVLKCRIHD